MNTEKCLKNSSWARKDFGKFSSSDTQGMVWHVLAHDLKLSLLFIVFRQGLNWKNIFRLLPIYFSEADDLL